MRKPVHWTGTWPLAHLALVTYAVPAARILPYLPKTVTLDTRTDAQGRDLGFVSAVMFLNDHTRPFPLPWPTMTFLQVNYRAYVHYKGKPCVWFFRIAQDSVWAGPNKTLFGVPSLRAPMRLAIRWDTTRRYYPGYRFDSVSPNHLLHVDLEGIDDEAAPGPLFSSSHELATFLTSRPDGFYYEPKRYWVSSMDVWHHMMYPKTAIARAASFSVLDELGLVPYPEQSRPYALLLQHWDVMLAQMPQRGIIRVPKPGLEQGRPMVPASAPKTAG